MKALLLLTILACCYQLSFVKSQKQYVTIWTNANFNGCNFIWNPKANFRINGSLFPELQYISCVRNCSIKKSSMVSVLHATALRLLLIIAGDVEENPGPINNQSASSTNQSALAVNAASQSAPSSSKKDPLQLMLPSTNQSDSKMNCSNCDRLFTRKSDLMRHMRTLHNGQKFFCSSCSYETGRKDNLKRHIAKSHQHSLSKQPRMHTPMIPTISTIAQPENIESEVAGVLQEMVEKVSQRSSSRRNALKGELKFYKISKSGDHRDIEGYLNETVGEIDGYVNEELSTRTGIKLLLNPHIEMFKPVHPEETTRVYFAHKPIEIFRESDTNQEIRSAFPALLKAVDEFTREGSGWAIQQILGVDIHIARLSMTRGSSYHKLSKELAGKEAIINIKNNDSMCFMWAILAKLHPISGKANPNRISHYKPFENELDFTGIQFPVKIKDITKIEKRNGLAINLYGYDNEAGLHPLRMSKETENRWIHLLLYEGHYSLIKNLDRLLFDQRGHKNRKYFCPRCLTAKYSNEDREAHYKVCCREDPTKIVMPEENELKFINFKKMLRQPLVIYADFECLTENVDGPNGAYQRHVPCGYGLVAVTGCCGSRSIDEPTIYRGDGSVKKFLTELRQYAADHQETLTKHEDYRGMEGFDGQIHQSNICHICKEEIIAHVSEYRKVRDHCHFCNKYRAPAHRRCNWQYRKNRDIVVVFHNLRKYDGHLLMQEIGSEAQLAGWEIDVVAKTMEDYISFSLVHKKDVEEQKGADELGDDAIIKDHSYKIKFIDSFQFMGRSLAELASNLENDQYHALSNEYEGLQLELLKRKGVYPYDYMDSWNKFEERIFPRKRDFSNQLNHETISDGDYRHAMEVWRQFEIRNLGQYHDLYLKTDVLLLADVFEQFRKIAIDNYGLDPCHYMTAPSLTWDACLKMTDVKLELLQDPDMYMFFEQGIRGGVSQISHRHAEANNQYLPEAHDSTKPTTYIMYLDANNLYGYAMVQSMPTHKFRCIKTEEDIKNIPDVTTIDDNAETGYVLEVDLEYPEDLHDAHSSYPLAPEHHTIAEVSPYCQHLTEKLGLKTPPTTKLITSLRNKKRYIIHYRNLKLYLSLGLKLRKIHQAVSFKQSKWMKSYIMANTRKRMACRNAFEKDFYKLMNNAAFGKTMENVRKYKNVDLVTSDVRHRKLAANPRYRHSTIFTEDLVGVCLLRPSTCLNKPVYSGFTVLELSKELMYQFHYQYIVPKYGSRVKLLFTDTDSLCYLIQTDDVYADMKQESDLFDFSDYSKDHQLYSTVNKKVIGKMKDETAGVPISKFIGLRPKMYAIVVGNKEQKTAKGIKKAVVKKAISYKDYEDVLFNEFYMRHDMNFIRSDKHQLYSSTISKTSLSPYDDKRWLLDNINSLPYGHYSTY